MTEVGWGKGGWGEERTDWSDNTSLRVCRGSNSYRLSGVKTLTWGGERRITVTESGEEDGESDPSMGMTGGSFNENGMSPTLRMPRGRS